MQHYRFFVLGQDGHFIKATDLGCEEDSAAIAATKPLIDGHHLEQCDCRIARFDAKPK